MTSKAKNVDAYMAGVPADRKPVIEKLRQLCRKKLAGYEECVEYGMPAYKKEGAVEIAFASQKQYISLYVMKKDVVDEFRSALPGCSIGKGCIRFTKPEQLDFAVLGKLFDRHVKARDAAVC